MTKYRRDSLVRCGATGAACLLIHRRVLSRMSRPGPKTGEQFDPEVHGFGSLPDGRANPHPWFSEAMRNASGAQLGEDIAFCYRALLMGLPLHVHTGIRVGHAKEWVIAEDDFDAYRRELARPSSKLRKRAVDALVDAGWSMDDVESIATYLAPRHGIVPATPAPEPFELPEPVPA